MSIGKLIGRGMFVALLAIGPAGGVFAASGHAHDQAAKSELTLNKGAKWQTDAALRQGMAALRGDLAAALPDIHHGRFTAAQYDALATRVEGHVEYLVTNCKPTPEADEQLHVVLGDRKSTRLNSSHYCA